MSFAIVPSQYPRKISRLADDVKKLREDFRAVRLQIVRDLRGSDDLVQQWVVHANTYRDIVADSRKTANTLAVVINLYTTLQSEVSSENAGDFVHELATMRETLQGPCYEFGSRLDGLKSAVESFAQLPRINRRMMQSPVSSSWLWMTVGYVGNILSSRTYGLDGGALSGAGQSSSKNASSTQSLVENIRNISSTLDMQKQELQVFQQILEQLTAEFNRYSAVLEKVAEHSSPEALQALRIAQQDVASNRRNWQMIAKALADQYARALG
ncbi:hypothetical protein OH77DRAFT_563301 [Trametes cingulata]|nr:hypothetical protein OH77DRAFT_563301 [Trametes cingulata]